LADPDCAGPDRWPAAMTFVQLKNAGVLTNDQVDFSRTASTRIASQKIGPDLYRQVYKVSYVLKGGARVQAIAISDASSQECSMSDVTVYRIADSINPADAPVTLSRMLELANAAVPRLTPAQAKAMMEQGGVLVLDVRDTQEIAASGKIAGAMNVPRGMLEFLADPQSPGYNKIFGLYKNKTLIVYCGSGARAALAGKTLKDMGYPHVYNLGGFKDWVDSGGAVEK